MSKLGEIETRRQTVMKKYGVESIDNWDDKAREGKASEKGYQGITDYFRLDELDWKKTELVKCLLSLT